MLKTLTSYLLALGATSLVGVIAPAQAFTPLSLTKTFNNPTPANFDNFGNSVSLSGTLALIGAYQDDTGATDAGSAYLFNTTTGNLLKTFNNPAPASSDRFGYSVSLSGTLALIGAYQDDTGASNAGSAYLFDTTTGNLLKTFNNPTAQNGDNFG
ncbi:FG-GAP repeat protein, partial [Microcystis aeruginosa]|uniref:FG-GAP repeat protein n=1 Tax=Microcystis aeruginosa TaxID=1126 RepID=UPI0005C6AA7E